jgi:thiamine kinase-like enzyme
VTYHDPYDRVTTLLSPDVLGRLACHPIVSVHLSPFAGDSGATASEFLRIDTNDGKGPRFVLKRVALATNWVMRATNDRQGRETLLWRSGLLDRFPEEIDHGVVACARDGDGWAILMRDVGDAFLPHSAFDREDNDRLLDALAALHATFLDQADALSSDLGFCSPWSYYTCLSGSNARREAREPDDFPSTIARGWDVLEQVLDSDVAAFARKLSDDPGPLCGALERYPRTLVHRDLNLGNVGIPRGERIRVVLIDWQLAGAAPPGVDLAGYVSEFSALLPVSKEEVVERYSGFLEARLGSRFDDHWWRPQVALALLGEFVRLAWAYAFHIAYDEDPSRRDWYRVELAWWSEQSRIGAREL